MRERTRRCACSRSTARYRVQDYVDFARAFAGIAKAFGVWIADGRARGVHLTVAGPRWRQDSRRQRHAEESDRSAAPVRRRASAAVACRRTRPRTSGSQAKIKVADDAEDAKVLSAVESALRADFSFEAREFGQPVTLERGLCVDPSGIGRRRRRHQQALSQGQAARVPAAAAETAAARRAPGGAARRQRGTGGAADARSRADRSWGDVMNAQAQRLFELLPAILRIRDLSQADVTPGLLAPEDRTALANLETKAGRWRHPHACGSRHARRTAPARTRRAARQPARGVRRADCGPAGGPRTALRRPVHRNLRRVGHALYRRPDRLPSAARRRRRDREPARRGRPHHRLPPAQGHDFRARAACERRHRLERARDSSSSSNW